MSEEKNLKEQLHALRIDRRAPPPPRRSSLRIGATIVVVAVLLAIGTFIVSGPLRGSAPKVEIAHARVVPGGEVPSAPVLSGAGYVITAEKYIAIGVRVPGRIERFHVDEGDRVEPGQSLVELDARDYRAQAGRAEAAVRLARANRDLAKLRLGRVRKLFDAGVTSAEELDEAVGKFRVADASVAQAENELAQARANLDDTVLRSPVRGVVLAKFKGVGEIAVPGGFAGAGDLLRIADLSEIRAEVDVSESDLGRIHLGQDAELVPDAYPDRRYRAVVVKRKPQVNRQKGTLTIEVRIEDPDEHLLPDMSARVTFLAKATAASGERGPTILVPRAAIRSGPGESFVWLVVDGHARRKTIEIGEEVGDEIAVRNGLSGGETVIVGPDGALRDGAAVEVS